MLCCSCHGCANMMHTCYLSLEVSLVHQWLQVRLKQDKLIC